MERRWGRHHALAALSADDAERLVRSAFPEAHVQAVEPLSGGLRNTNLRLTVRDGPSPLVLRLYVADPSACSREVAVLGALPPVVPRPALLHAEPQADPPWALFSWLEGGPLDVALKMATPEEGLMLANDSGALLSAIHRVRFPRSGFLGEHLSLGEPLGTWRGILESLLVGVAGERLGRETSAQLHAFASRHAAEMDPLFDDAVLCHGDFKPWNLLARASSGTDDRARIVGSIGWGFATPGLPLFDTADRPRLSGIVDWEFAFAGPALFDVGTFLRDEARLPAGFGEAFAAGYRRWNGVLPGDWRRLARRLDLINLCQLIERGDERVLADLRPLIRMTLELDQRSKTPD